jgi:ATP synthase protein I
MTDEPRTPAEMPASPLAKKVAPKEARKLRAKRHPDRGVWFGLGMVGLIGWSVSVPTLLGAFLGLWLDRIFPGGRSWTLALLVGGLVLGCWNAWYWLAKENKAIRQEQEDNGE